jgi:hypothetical protein
VDAEKPPSEKLYLTLRNLIEERSYGLEKILKPFQKMNTKATDPKFRLFFKIPIPL